MGLITYIILGAIAGWIAGDIMHLPRRGFVKTVIIGIMGSAVGGAVMRLLGFYAHGFLSQIIVAVIGACLFLYFAKRIL